MAVEMFFSTVAVPAAGNDTNLQGVSPGEKDRESDSIMLLSGPPSCGKTSLLFQFALNSVTASETNRYVVFICNRRKLEAKPFYLFQGIDPSSDKLFLERIHIKYVDDDEGIMKYFAAFHLFPTCPAAVIIDDFAEFFDERECQQRYGNGNPRGRGRDLAMVRVLALCQNAIAHANEKAPCKLLLSDTHHGDSARLLFIYKRWVSSFFTIRVFVYVGVGGASGSTGSYLLSNSNISVKGCDEGRVRTARYSIALQYLVLEGITVTQGSRS